MFTKNTSHPVWNRKQIARQVKITRVQEKSYQPEKWKLTETVVCYSNEYATDIMDILNNTISQEVP